MRILVLPKDFPSQRRAHPGAFVLRDVKALAALGHEVAVLRIVPHAPALPKWRAYWEVPAQEEVDGIPVRTIRAFFPPRMIGMEWVASQVHRAIAREIASFRPDVLHAHFLIPSGQAAVRHSVPVVVTAHGSDAYDWPNRRRGLHRAAREAISAATEVTAVSAFIRECVQRMVFRDVHVIYNGADDRVFYPRDSALCRDQLQLPRDRVVVAYAGNLLRAKGLFDLIAAASRMPRDSRVTFAIAGSGPDSEALQSAAAQGGADVRFYGTLGSEDVGRLFGACDVATLPSHNEGLPNVICEAMASSRTVLATRVGGIPEIVSDGATGVLVPPHDVGALCDALTTLASDASARARMGAAGREIAAQGLTSGVTARRYEAVYAQAVQRHSSKGQKKSA